VEQTNNRQTELFWELLANPADKSYSHVQNLRQLVSEYPQSSLLRSLLVYAGEDDQLGHAAAYADPRLLHKLRNDADGLSAVNADQLIKSVSEKRYFHSNAEVHEPEAVITPEREIHLPVTETEPEQEVLADEYTPIEHFFEPEITPEEHLPETHEPEITAEPEKLDDLINYGDEVTTGEHELVPPVTEFHHVEQYEAVAPQPELEHEVLPGEETIPQPEHSVTEQEEQPVAEVTAPEEPVTEQPLPFEEPHQEPQTEEQVELPTLGFYVPSMDNGGESYTGGDISSKLYESYTQAFEPAPQPSPQPIEDEVFDEIVGIDDINVPVPESFTEPKDEVPQSPQPVDELEQPTLGFQIPPVAETAKDESSAKNRKVDLTDEAEKLMLNNIAATDFFVFDQALSERIKSGDEVKESAASASSFHSDPSEITPQNAEQAANEQAGKKVEYERVTKYFDEKMPYSFMWWLDKTRKEHSGIYQPFVLDTSQKIEKNIPDELQQQYYENIFQLTSVDELERATGKEPVKFDSKKKEDEIIERFIHEAPQIKPQTSEKLDNENKAKRSSEDQDEIVTETLAHIYADQMLYHKAIKVYQKLMLKFPEKRRYFAGQIEQLEKKIS
jgi:hypothetical protein